MIAPENTKSLSEFCRKAYYSLVIDESTDCTIIKNLAIVIRVFDKVCKDRFLRLVPITDSTADGIFKATTECLNELSIPIQNMVGFTSDNCAVMTGDSNGVRSKLKLVVPSLFGNGCICHILHLVTCAAAKEMPNYIDTLIIQINSHFCNSSVRRQEFQEFQQYFGTEEHKILKYAQTRWLSRQAVIDRLI